MTIYDSQHLLEVETHAYRLDAQERDAGSKGTGEAYQRHQRNYHSWFASDQENRAKECPGYMKLSSQSINATKVAAFLEFETGRPKVRVSFLSYCMVLNLLHRLRIMVS
jgi:hypothetical protein